MSAPRPRTGFHSARRLSHRRRHFRDLAGVSRRFGSGCAALVHADLGTGDEADNRRLAAQLGPVAAPLLCPGGLLLGDRAFPMEGCAEISAAAGAAAGRYFVYRRLADVAPCRAGTGANARCPRGIPWCCRHPRTGVECTPRDSSRCRKAVIHKALNRRRSRSTSAGTGRGRSAGWPHSPQRAIPHATIQGLAAAHDPRPLTRRDPPAPPTERFDSNFQSDALGQRRGSAYVCSKTGRYREGEVIMSHTTARVDNPQAVAGTVDPVWIRLREEAEALVRNEPSSPDSRSARSSTSRTSSRP